MEGCTFVPKITKYKKKRNMSSAVDDKPTFNASVYSKEREKELEPSPRKLSTQSMGVFEKLNKTKQRNLQKYEKKKEDFDLKGCTFKPNIARKSVKMAMKSFKASNVTVNMSTNSGYTKLSQRSGQSVGTRIENLYQLN